MHSEFLSFALGRSADGGDLSPPAVGADDGADSPANPAAVAASQNDGDDGSTTTAPTARGQVSPFGMVFRFGSNAVSIGRDPHDIAPPGNWVAYDPRFIAILYLKLGPNWDISVNHASYPVDQGADRLARALEVIAKKVSLSDQRGGNVDFGHQDMLDLDPYRQPEPLNPTRPFDSGTFDDFKFKSQNEIFIFLHHPDMQIRTTENALIGLKSGYNDRGKMRDLNTCFFHARTVPAADMQGLDPVGKLIRLENYATDQNGELLLEGDDRNYSLDILFQVDAGSAGWITMVVDPDTGNGMGYQP